MLKACCLAMCQFPKTKCSGATLPAGGADCTMPVSSGRSVPMRTRLWVTQQTLVLPSRLTSSEQDAWLKPVPWQDTRLAATHAAVTYGGVYSANRLQHAHRGSGLRKARFMVQQDQVLRRGRWARLSCDRSQQGRSTAGSAQTVPSLLDQQLQA